MKTPLPKVIAVTAVRNEQEYLLGLLNSVGPLVRTFMVVDDASTDSTKALLKFSAEVSHTYRHEETCPTHHRESENRKRLFDMAVAHGGPQPWLLCMDADERLDKNFLFNLDAICAEAEYQQIFKIAVRLREMWRSNYYRIDGIWGTKRKVVLFKLPAVYSAWPAGLLHNPWPPPEMQHLPTLLVKADMYHLKMISAKKRTARREKFQQIDPTNAALYDYLDKEDGALLERVEDALPSLSVL
jgi:glycosyltransferase involved in cell wall biosynthesis